MSQEILSFDPVLFSDAENRWLLEHIGQPSIVAIRDVRPQVNPRAVKPLLDRVNELDELEKHEGVKWCGIEPIKKSIQAWLEQNAKWQYDHRRTRGRAPRWPSLYAYDAKGRPHRGGPGSDSDRVRTYFGSAGERIPFEVLFFPETATEWKAPTLDDKPATKGLLIDPATTRIECLLCGHTEVYKKDSRSSYNAARARMSKHLRKATERAEEHREVHSEEFGS